MPLPYPVCNLITIQCSCFDSATAALTSPTEVVHRSSYGPAVTMVSAWPWRFNAFFRNFKAANLSRFLVT